MSDVEKYEILVLGSGGAGKVLAWTMAKDVVLFAVSVYLLKQDVVRASLSAGAMTNLSTIRPSEMVEPPYKLGRMA
jgi:hypothetical protein